jgi:hypothetical protein
MAAAHHWDEALAAGETLLAELADDPDDNSTVQGEVARLRTAEEFYRQALTAYQARRWDRAADLLRQVRGIERISHTAQMAARIERWAGLYERGLAALGRREWVDALTLLAGRNKVKDIRRCSSAREEPGRQTDLIRRYDSARADGGRDWQEPTTC